MISFLLVVLAGFGASMVDGSLGMGFGPTSSTLLLSAGVTPAMAATTINVAKVATGVASGTAHWRLGNIDKPLTLMLAVPGAAGALVGTTLLTRVDSRHLRPVLAILLIAVGIRILIRFSRDLPAPTGETSTSRHTTTRHPATAVTAMTGGVTNGLVGAWGPVVTPYLLQRGLPPRIVVGSVNTAEVAVAVVSAASLLGTLGRDGVDGAILVGMLIGGVAAAPLAALVIRRVPPRALGLLIAGLLLGTQGRELVRGVSPALANGLLCTVLALVLAAALRPRFQRRTAEQPTGTERPMVSVAATPPGRR